MQSMYLSLFIYSMCFFTVYTVIFHLSICLLVLISSTKPRPTQPQAFSSPEASGPNSRAEGPLVSFGICASDSGLLGEGAWLAQPMAFTQLLVFEMFDGWKRMLAVAVKSHDFWEIYRGPLWARCRLSHLSPTPATAGCITSQCGPNPTSSHIFA